MLKRKEQKQALNNFLFQKKTNSLFFSLLVNIKACSTSYHVLASSSGQEGTSFEEIKSTYPFTIRKRQGGISSYNFDGLEKSNRSLYYLPFYLKRSIFIKGKGVFKRPSSLLKKRFFFPPYLHLTDKEVRAAKPRSKTPSHSKGPKETYENLSRNKTIKKLSTKKEKKQGKTIDSDFNPSTFLSTDRVSLGRKFDEFEGSKTKKSRFLKERNAYLIPDFVEIQRKSFFQLLENGLIEEFAKRNPITNKNLEIFFYPEYYQLTPPEYNPRRAILISKSYSSKLFIPAQLTDKKLKKSQLKWVLIGNLPLMTKRGHFVLNGAPRVIVNQILRSPGIYFQGSLKEIFSDQWSEKPEITYKRFYTDLICLRGTWLRIEIDKNKDIWAQMKKVPKIPLLWFLLAMGLTERIIFKSVLNPTRLLANFNLSIKRKIDYEYVTNASDAWKAISTLISSSTKESTSYNISPPTLIIPQSSVSFDSVFESDSDVVSDSDPGSQLLIGNSGLLPNSKSESIPPMPSEPTNQKRNLKGGKKQEKVVLALQKKKQGKVSDKNKQSNLTVEKNQSSLFSIGTKNLLKSKESEEQKIRPERKLVSFLNIVEHSKEGRNWIFKRFMNPRAYDLGSQGRLNFNRKLGLSISSNQTTLTAQDVLFATDYLFKVEKGLKNIDDIDHLKNRRVRTSGELLQIQIGIGLVRLEKIIREKLSKINAQTRASDFLTNRPNIPKGQIFKLESLPFRASLKKKVLLTPNKKRKKKLPSFPSLSLLSLPVGTASFCPPRGEGLLLPVLPKQQGGKENKKENKEEASFFPNLLRTSGVVLLDSLPLLKKKKPLKNKKKERNESTIQYDSSPNRLSQKQGTKIQGGKTVFGGIIGEEFKMNNLINTKAFNGALREFFGSSQLSQFMDQLNPLAEITHKRRLSSMGPGGVTRDSATLAIRGIHPTHYGRICPIETPEGKNTGLVNSLTTYSRASSQGFLESPFYKVYKGQVQKNAGMFFLSAEQEENIKVAAADVSTTSGRVCFLPKNKIPAKIAYGDTISKILRNTVEYIGVSPIQMISIATSLIPFVEHDDANRALMGSNMQRQAVPLVRAERPLVGTGLESRTVSDSGHAVIAKESGYVAYVSGKKMVIYTIPLNP